MTWPDCKNVDTLQLNTSEILFAFNCFFWTSVHQHSTSWFVIFCHSSLQKSSRLITMQGISCVYRLHKAFKILGSYSAIRKHSFSSEAIRVWGYYQAERWNSVNITAQKIHLVSSDHKTFCHVVLAIFRWAFFFASNGFHLATLPHSPDIWKIDCRKQVNLIKDNECTLIKKMVCIDKSFLQLHFSVRVCMWLAYSKQSSMPPL